MGLRINNNRASITALKNLRVSDRRQAGSLERLSTGLRINRAQDDPSGLVVSERLRAQLSSLKQAQQNANHASNLILTAENAVGQIQDLAITIRESIVFALNSGGNTPETIQAEQDAVDRAIEAIERIAETTRFGDANLLNGTRGFNVLSGASTAFTQIQPFSVRFDRTQSATTFNFRLALIPSQAIVGGLNSTAVATPLNTSMTLRVTGKQGTEEIQLRSNATWGEMRDAVNILRGNTGVYASGFNAGGGAVLNFVSEEYGTDGFVRIERVDANGGAPPAGTIPTGGPGFNDSGFLSALGGMQQDFGANGIATINGDTMRNDDLEFSVANEFFDGNIRIDPTAMTTNSTYTFRIKNDTGMRFQLNVNAGPSDEENFGMQSLRASFLGTEAFARGGITEGGYLTSLHMGRENDLLINPTNALRIIDSVIDQISDLRSFMGSFDRWNVQQSIDQLGTHIENLSASESDVRDLDFAEETANFTRAQILFQAGTAVMAQANLIPQSVLQLLQ